MALTNGTIKSLANLDAAFGWKAPGSEADLRDLLQEIQGLRVSIVPGAAQSVQCKVLSAGGISNGTSDNITSEDVILAAISFATANGAAAPVISLRGDVRVSTSTGYVKFTAGATTSNDILLFWYDKTGYIAQ